MKERIDTIDCLRGVAILAVLLVHDGQAVVGLPDWLQHITSYGGRGVQLFFILSALALLSVYCGRATRSHSPARGEREPASRSVNLLARGTRAFFIRRLFRLAPMFYLGIGFYLFYHGLGAKADTPDGIGWRQIALTFTFLHGWTWDSINSVVPGGWSIANEAMFYALFPLLLRTLTSLRRSLLAFALALVISRASFVLIPQLFAGHATPHLLDIFAAFSFPTQLPAFIGGFVVYFAIQGLGEHREHILWRKTTARSACMLITASIAYCAISGDKTLSNYLLADMLLMHFVLAVYLAQPRIILNAVLRHLGRISYSLYLIHFAVLDGVTAPLLPMISNAASAQQLVLVYGATLAVSVALATLTWRFIELPTIAWGRKVSGRYIVD